MPLTDTAIRRALPGPNTQKLTDGQGMYLEVAPSGGKRWRLKYRITGVEKRLSLGTYTDISVKVARQRRDDARALIVQGIDPSDVRKASKVQAQTDEADAAREAAGLAQPNSFEHIAHEPPIQKPLVLNRARGFLLGGGSVPVIPAQRHVFVVVRSLRLDRPSQSLMRMRAASASTTTWSRSEFEAREIAFGTC